MKTNKNNIPIIVGPLTEADFLRRIRDREDRERQLGFCQDNEIILQQRAIDRSYGNNGFSGRP